jgi:hypothetical protein
MWKTIPKASEKLKHSTIHFLETRFFKNEKGALRPLLCLHECIALFTPLPLRLRMPSD